MSTEETFTYINNRGIKYYLHSREISLRNTNEIQVIYFFSKVEKGSVNQPQGYSVIENMRSGLPFLKRDRD